jgi:hypothetical protein
MSKLFDLVIYAVSPARWSWWARRAFVILLPISLVYLAVGWLLIIVFGAVAMAAFAVGYAAMMAIGVPVFWCGQQLFRLWERS